MTDQQKRRQVYDEDGKPVYGDDGKPLLEDVDPVVPDNRPGWLKFIAPDGPLAQTGRGISQSIMSSLIPLADIALSATPAKGFVPRQAVQALTEATATPHTPIERGAKFAGDVGQFIAPLSRAASVAKPLQRAAIGIESLSTGMGKEAAELALKEHMGLATPANARKLYGRIVASEARPVSTTGVVNYPAPPGALSRLRPDSWDFKRAAARGNLRTLGSTAAAQGLNVIAPALEQSGAGGGALLAAYLKSLFGGGSE